MDKEERCICDSETVLSFDRSDDPVRSFSFLSVTVLNMSVFCGIMVSV